jgi:serine/threonine protein kinase
LITDSGRPCLSDFGLSKVLLLSGMTTTADMRGTLRWISPELIEGETISAESDVWAYAMTVLASPMSDFLIR